MKVLTANEWGSSINKEKLTVCELSTAMFTYIWTTVIVYGTGVVAETLNIE